MSIVTRTGDKGETGLVGGSRVSKADTRLHACGAVDELNAVLGMVMAQRKIPKALRPQFLRLQHLLFRVGADFASPLNVKGTKRIGEEHTKEVEGWLTALEDTLPALTSFILPGGTAAGSLLHVARTVCRRAERWAVALSETEEINREAIVFLNRLSDYFFLAARETNRNGRAAEVAVEY